MFIDVRYMILFIGECYIYVVEKFLYVYNLNFFFLWNLLKLYFFIYEVRMYVMFKLICYVYIIGVKIWYFFFFVFKVFV